jgi:hypothetical protein
MYNTGSTETLKIGSFNMGPLIQFVDICRPLYENMYSMSRSLLIEIELNFDSIELSYINMYPTYSVNKCWLSSLGKQIFYSLDISPQAVQHTHTSLPTVA